MGSRTQSVAGVVIIVFAACGLAVSGLFGLVGSPVYPERFDAKTVVITPTATHADGLRITEYVDIDFGTSQRRGYERYIPVDFGEPTDVTASSPSAPDDVSVERVDDEVRIRIGDPQILNTGRHRYVLAYTLPATGLADGVFALDVIGTEETLGTEVFTVVISGIDLDEVVCSVGATGEVGGCTLTRSARGLETEFTPLEPGQGITIEGRVTAVSAPTAVDPGPPLPERTPDDTLVVTGLMLFAGLGAGWAMRRRSISKGSNLIGGDGTVAGAAYGGGSGPTRRVTDRELAAMATTEFSPPREISPWEGTVIIDEALTESATEAWFTTLHGQGVIEMSEVTERAKGLKIAPGPKIGSLDPTQSALLAQVLPDGNPRVLTGYDAEFSELWTQISTWQSTQINARQWWQGKIGATTARTALIFAAVIAVITVIATAVIGAGITSTGALLGAVTGTIWFAVLWSATAVALVTLIASAATRRSRTAAGSAAYLMTESFRRFLATSEARHVEEAWKRGVIREYTAWAVALGEADAWRRAAQSVTEPAALAAVTTTAFASHRYFSTAHTNPSSSGSGSGGGSGVGSGGGGGRSGSW